VAICERLTSLPRLVFRLGDPRSDDTGPLRTGPGRRAPQASYEVIRFSVPVPLKLRTIFFDWGGTLALVPPDLNRPEMVWSSTCADFGIQLPTAKIRRAHEEVDRSLGPEIYGYVGRTYEFWRRYNGAMMDRLGIQVHREEIEVAVQRRYDDVSVVQLYPETRSVLNLLRTRGYVLGLISNHNDRLLDVLKYHRLDTTFRSVTYSQEVGAEKPSPAVFARALERAGCLASEAVHVGDSLQADVDGARACGLRAVWLNRDGRPGETAARTIRTLSELVPLVEQLVGPDGG
jgi:putative hydrolase of the HAD superfamily